MFYPPRQNSLRYGASDGPRRARAKAPLAHRCRPPARAILDARRAHELLIGAQAWRARRRIPLWAQLRTGPNCNVAVRRPRAPCRGQGPWSRHTSMAGWHCRQLLEHQGLQLRGFCDISLEGPVRRRVSTTRWYVLAIELLERRRLGRAWHAATGLGAERAHAGRR